MDKCFYCYVTESRAVFRLRKGLANALERLLPMIDEAFETAALRRAGVAPDDVVELLKYGVMTRLPKDMVQKGMMSSSIGHAQAPIVNITAILSSNCNLACKYCYAKSRINPKNMSQEIGRKTIDFLIAESNEESSLHITFFGGEPLLNFPVLKEMVEYGEREASVRMHPPNAKRHRTRANRAKGRGPKG